MTADEMALLQRLRRTAPNSKDVQTLGYQGAIVKMTLDAILTSGLALADAELARECAILTAGCDCLRAELNAAHAAIREYFEALDSNRALVAPVLHGAHVFEAPPNPVDAAEATLRALVQPASDKEAGDA